MATKESMDWELWGTFSVGDHLRRRAFIADVLLYDRLVIPIPPPKDSEELRRWHEMGWRPERQRRLLGLLGRDRVVSVPWTPFHRESWEALYRDAQAYLRSKMAQAASADAASILQQRETFDWTGWEKRGGKPEEVDMLAHFTSREYLVDWTSMKHDTELFIGVPKVEVEAITAYGSYDQFSQDYCVTPINTEQTTTDTTLSLFGWDFLVPNNTNRSNDDLLKEAVELANLEQTKDHRRLFHKWRRGVLLTGRPVKEALEEMEEKIASYHGAVRKTKIKTGTKYAFAIISAVAGAAAVAVPPMGVSFGIAGAFAGFGSFLASETKRGEVPEELKVAAMFHDARRRFGWYRRLRRRR